MKGHTELVIFDWDGTLMDSERHIVASLREASRLRGLDVLPDGTYRNVIGLGMREAVQALYPEQMSEEFAQSYTEAYREFFFDPDAPQGLFEGARDTVDYLLGKGYQLAVATGKSRHGLEKVLGELGMEQCFHATRCADETGSKPDPRMLNEILDELGLPAERSVMVGDTEYDLAMASYGVHDTARLMQHAPVACIDRITDLPGLLSELPRKRRA